MAIQRLFRHTITVLTGASGSDTRVVPAALVDVEVYRQGATIKTGKTLLSGADTITVYDPGSIRVNDVIQYGIDDTTTWSVTSVSADTITVLSGNGKQISQGARLVTQSARPEIYTNIEGQSPVSGGVAPPTGTGTGLSAFYTKFPVCDIILIGGTLSQNQLIIDDIGLSNWDRVSLEEFGGAEASVLPANTDNLAAFNAAIDYMQAHGPKILQLGPGIYNLSGVAALQSCADLTIRGAGRTLTTINLTNSSGAAISFDSATSTCNLQDLSLSRTSGTASVIEIQSGALGIELENVGLINVGGGVTDSGVYTRVNNLWGEGTASTIMTLIGAIGGRYETVRAPGINTNTAAGLITVQADSTDCEFIAPYLTYSLITGGPAVTIQNGAGGPPSNIKFIGGTYSGGDHAANGRDAIVISSGLGIKFIGPRVQKSRQGTVITGGTDLAFSDGTYYSIRQNGIDIQGGGVIKVCDMTFANCGKATNNTFDGVKIGGGVSDVHVENLDIGNFIDGGANFLFSGVNLLDGAGQRIYLNNINADTATVTIPTRIQKTTANWNDIFMDLNRVGVGVPATTLRTGIAFFGNPQTDNSTTPSVESIGQLVLQYGAGITITNFTNGTTGQMLFVSNQGANAVTIQHNATTPGIRTITAANINLAVNMAAMFFLTSTGVWREIDLART